MTWTINVPHRDRSESLIDTAAHARHLDGNDRAVARELALAAHAGGLRTAGELIDHLERLDPAQRRAMLDNARAEVGLDSTSEADIRSGVGLSCAPDNRPMRLVHTEGGPLREVYADETEITAADERRRSTEREAREQQRRIDLADHEDAERAQRDALRRELPEHLRGLV